MFTAAFIFVSEIKEIRGAESYWQMNCVFLTEGLI